MKAWMLKRPDGTFAIWSIATTKRECVGCTVGWFDNHNFKPVKVLVTEQKK